MLKTVSKETPLGISTAPHLHTGLPYLSRMWHSRASLEKSGLWLLM